MARPRVLVVDLNNFARYPTVAVGYIVSILRRAEFDAEVFSPFALGVPGMIRERREPLWGLLDQRMRYLTAVSRSRLVRSTRAVLAARAGPRLAREKQRVVDAFCATLDRGYDAVLISTYLMYHEHCVDMARACRDAGVPCLIGGQYFVQPEVAREWLGIDGIAGLVAGEVEPDLPEIVRALVAREPLDRFDGVWVPGSSTTLNAPPLERLDDVPFPDYSDFPWDRYSHRIVPMITGRGCGWGACTFCSDVTSGAGRTFRTRSAENVLEEMAYQSRRHETSLFVFVDLKLNSSEATWHGLIDRAGRVVRDAHWIAALHIDGKRDNGLQRAELEAARAAGMVRLTTGLESGSQRVLDRMSKGTDLAVTSRVLTDARAAGISVRTTMIVGYPGEEASDVERSAKFLAEHADAIERVRLNRFQIMTGTRVHRRLERKPETLPDVTPLTINHREAQIEHDFAPAHDRAYRRAIMGLLGEVHRINRRPLQKAARPFEGVM